MFSFLDIKKPVEDETHKHGEHGQHGRLINAAFERLDP